MNDSNIQVSYEDLEVKHMAYLLKNSLFKTTRKSEIRTALFNIQDRSQTGIWQSE